MTRNYKLAIIVVVLALAVTLAFGAVTFAKYREDFSHEGNNGHVASTVAKLDFKAIYRTDSEGNKERIAFDRDEQTITVKDVEPQDVIDYYFSISDADGASRNEVLLQITLAITVRLEMIFSGENSVSKAYFEGWKTYSDSADVKNGGYLQIFRGNDEQNESQIRPSSGESSEVDYTGYTLHVDKSGDEIVNKTGFYLQPYSQAVSEHVYHVSFTLPKQSSDTENYAGARLYFDINMACEQAQK